MFYCKNIAIVLYQQCKLGFNEKVIFFQGEYLYKALTNKKFTSGSLLLPTYNVRTYTVKKSYGLGHYIVKLYLFETP